MQKALSELKIGEGGKVAHITTEGKIKRRLLDMGVTPNATVIMQHVAPMGDPIEITLRGYQLSLRKSEADTVVVEVGE